MKKILVVEDTVEIRFFLRRVLVNKNYSVTTAENGEDAINQLKDNNFDIIITDLLMPVIDGITLINIIRTELKEQPIIIVLTALVSDEARHKAIYAGADEFLTKPIGRNELLTTIDLTIKRNESNKLKLLADFKKPQKKRAFYCIGIASSTGGPQTLSALFESLGQFDRCAFLITQHGPPWMLETLVKALQRSTIMPVFMGKDKLEINPGNVYLAPGGNHMILSDNPLKIELLDSPPENYVKPSADPMFRSIAEKFGLKAVGIVLTGMGQDGSIGAGYISVAGGKVIAQYPDFCILPSMPKSVINLNLADHVTQLENIPEILSAIIK